MTETVQEVHTPSVPLSRGEYVASTRCECCELLKTALRESVEEQNKMRQQLADRQMQLDQVRGWLYKMLNTVRGRR